MKFKRALILWCCLLLSSCSAANYLTEADVISIQKKIDLNDPLHSMCSSLFLNKKDVVTYYTVAEEVDAGDFAYNAIILPCSYRGEIKVKGALFRWEIYAGGSAFLYSDKESRRYLCRNQCCSHFSTLC